MDGLTILLNQYAVSAGVFYAGGLCGAHAFPEDAQRGHLHLLRGGCVLVDGFTASHIVLSEPTLLFLPRPGPHRLIVPPEIRAEMVCGTVEFGKSGWNPLTACLPDLLTLPLNAMPGLSALVDAMFDEAFQQRLGRQAVLDRYCEIVMVRLLDYCVERGLAAGGALAGLAHPRLAPVLQALHANPEQAWPLSSMAVLAGMSRSRFALLFREVTGDTPADYLATWRIATAQRLLQRGRSLKHVFGEVGFASASAFHRAFVRKTGLSPGNWLKQSAAVAEMNGHECGTVGAPGRHDKP
ncbi:AraC family transcriptional regulator [Vogesella sp. XCS3]|uniref:AraC family transcriptional regulator n=1 Tax=Vogesella sp. XCS3 TaxID=2877939 RepID=UPI001D09F889|nr:AraC family transcriptional regulator [Vogesella sp. XCS3]UDM18255.1 AraC family transcriptional regulator [Vogesella sp. XCS3]